MSKHSSKTANAVSTGSTSVFTKILIGLIIVFAVASGIAIYFEQEEQFNRIQANQRELQRELDHVYAKNGELKALQELVDTDAYIEKIARDQLGMVRPDEIVFENQ